MFGWWRRWLDRKVDRAIERRMEAKAASYAAASDNEAKQMMAKISSKWLEFNRTMPFRDDVTMAQRIAFFAEPATVFVEAHYPAIHKVHPHMTPICIVTAICDADPSKTREVMVAAIDVWPEVMAAMNR